MQAGPHQRSFFNVQSPPPSMPGLHKLLHQTSSLCRKRPILRRVFTICISGAIATIALPLSIQAASLNISGIGGSYADETYEGGTIHSSADYNFHGDIVNIGTLTIDGKMTVYTTGSLWNDDSAAAGRDGSIIIVGTLNNYNGDITNDGNIDNTGTLSNSGTFQNNATINSTGSIINSGTFKIGNGGTTGAVSGDISNSGSIEFNRSDTTTYSDVISGTGSLTQSGTGILILTGNNSYSGGTTISSGTLQVGNGGTTGAIVGDITNNAILIFNRSDELTYAGVISGTGTLTKSGAGNLILTGTNTYSGATTVSAGRLSVNGSITSAVTVQNGATLGGTGTVGQTTISSGGTHAPGNSIGTQTINGNYTLGNGSVLEIEVDSAGNSDKVIVNGTVDITGATLNIKGVVDNDFSGEASYSYIIIENDGADAVTGDFATIDNDLAFYEAATSIAGGDGNDVSLTLTRNASSFTDIAQTRNQKAVANQIRDLSGSDGTTIKNAILGLTTEMTLHAYDQLSGDIYAATPEISNRISRQANSQISARLADLQHNRNVTGTLVAANALSPAQLAGFTQSGPVASDNTTYGSDAPMLSLGTENALQAPSAIWVQTIGATGQIDGDSNADTTDYKWTGMIGGYDTHLSDATVLGVYFGYADAENRQSDRDATLDSGNLMAGIYGTHDLGDDLRLYGQAGWTRIAVDSSRNLDFGSIDRTATADYTDTAINAEIELAKGFDLPGNWRYEPYAGLGLQWNDYDSFEENGAGSANLSRSADHALTGTTRLGLRVAGMFKTDNDRTIIPQFGLGWDHHLGQTTNSTTLAFSGTSSFTVTGTDTDRDTLTGNIGFALADPDGWSLYADYQPSLSKNSTEHAFAAGFRMIF